MNRGTKEQTVAGWGNYPKRESRVYRPESLPALKRAVENEPKILAAGMRRSYGDASLAPVSIDMTRIDRILSFDRKKGIVEAEAGLSLAHLLDVIAPKGWFVQVTPGTKHVTLGGCVASNVHGKNHHKRGSFGNSVLGIQLLLADGSLVECSRRKRPDLFKATLGGMGLTGVVYAVKLQLVKIESEYIDVEYRRCTDIQELFDTLSIMDKKYEYTVAWVDCLARGKRLGRGIVMGGRHSCKRGKERGQKRPPTVPFHLPGIFLNRLSVTLFNKLYYLINNRETRHIHYDQFFYPLDAVNNWNKIYGKRGFIQYQFVLPVKRSREGIIRILEVVSRAGSSSFLSVLKKFAKEDGLLSFPHEGYTLTLDFPVTKRLPALIKRLDAIVEELGGRLYLTKDAMMTKRFFRKGYPKLVEWRKIKRRYDPKNKFVGAQAERLGVIR